MKQIIPEFYVSNCLEALEYYKNTFGGEIGNVRTGEIINVRKGDNSEKFKGLDDKIIHSELHIGDGCDLYLVDILDDKNVGSTELVLQMDNDEELKRVYDALSKNGNVTFPLQKILGCLSCRCHR